MSHPSYYLNLCGKSISDDSMQSIPCPRFELLQHVTIKTTQAGGLIGALIAAPITSVIKGQTDFNSIQDRAYHFGKNGIYAGLVVGPLLTAAFCPGKSFDSMVDRCYRIRLNKGQVRADRFSILGIAAGMGVAHYYGEMLTKGVVLGYVGGFFVGTVLNVIV